MNPFGKMLRQERKEKGITLATMADALGVSSPYLSQMETGGKPVKSKVVEKAIIYLDLSACEAEQLRRAAAKSTPKHVSSVGIKLPASATNSDRELASRFALNFHRWKPEQKARLREMLENVDLG
ncbi:helix-turn-helix domain-containing protein [Erythrobacter aureus]|uniref:helix-turn-helix domain-containing protein n=1 Tax=Erythrobacter aureus TaxID=2182384 RepID=UPI003A957265